MIRKAGVAGQTVTVWGLKAQGFEQVTEYFVKLLDSLDFKAKAHLTDAAAFFDGLGSPTSGVSTSQMAGYWASSPIASGASEFPGFFTCPGFSTDSGMATPTTSRSGHRPGGRHRPGPRGAGRCGLSRQGERHLGQGGPGIVDAAPAVTPFYPVDVDLLSKRTGGFQHHPFWNILLDQLWVQ